MKRTSTLKLLLMNSLLFFGTVSFGQVTTGADDGSPGTLRNQIAAASPGATIDIPVTITNITLTEGQITIDKSLTLSGNILFDYHYRWKC